MKAFLFWLFLLTQVSWAASAFLPIQLPVMNGNLQERNPAYPAGNLELGGVPFFIPTQGNNYFNAEFAAPRSNQTVNLSVPINQIGITGFHTLINTFWGQPGPSSYASITFNYADGTQYVRPLYGNSDIRDYYNNTWTNNLNGTTTRQVFFTNVNGAAGPNPYRLDKLFIDLSAYSSELLLSVVFTDLGATSFQRIFVSGITIEASGYSIELDVPILKQDNPLWRTDIMVPENPATAAIEQRTIWGKGCALTSVAMMLRSYNFDTINIGTVLTPDWQILDPGTLNTWLRKHDGYTPSGNLVWASIASLTSDKVVLKELSDGMNTQALTEDIENSIPVIVEVRGVSDPSGSHFVIVRGKFVDAQNPLEDYFLINDPVNNIVSLDDPHYNNTWKGHRRFTPSNGITRPTLSVLMHSPAEILVTDKDGRRCGFDPTTGNVFTEIPGGSTCTEAGIVDPQGIEPATPEHKELYLMNADNGPYQIAALGTGHGDYKMEIVSRDANGGITIGVISGKTFPGKIDSFNFEDSPDGRMSLKSPGGLKGGGQFVSDGHQVVITCNMSSNQTEALGSLDFHFAGQGRMTQATSFDTATFQDGMADIAGQCDHPGSTGCRFQLSVKTEAKGITTAALKIVDAEGNVLFEGQGRLNGNLQIAY